MSEQQTDNGVMSVMLTPRQAAQLRTALAKVIAAANRDAMEFKDDGIPALVNLVVNEEMQRIELCSLESVSINVKCEEVTTWE